MLIDGWRAGRHGGVARSAGWCAEWSQTMVSLAKARRGGDGASHAGMMHYARRSNLSWWLAGRDDT